AFREAKRRTSWLEPDESWERRIFEWARAKRETAGGLAERVRAEGERISLGMLILKLVCPGVPDIYQGDELQTLALVDPANRRPVDWELRQRLLADDPARDRKLWVTSRLLDLRRRRPEAFAGGYMPVRAADDVCAFMRGPDVLVVVPLSPTASREVD